MTRDSFLARVLENPDADEPRLQYADWLDETCDPRGEFIRVQCRLARHDGANDRYSFELETRQRELLGEFEAVWVQAVATIVDGWSFHRGFVNEVIMPAQSFIEQGPALCRLTPLQELHLHHVNHCLEELACSVSLARVRFLDFSENRLGDGGLRLLAKSPHLRGVRGLNLSATAAGDAGVHALARSEHLRNLSELYLSANNVGDDGVRALAHSPYLERLQTLFLDFNRISSAGAKTLRQRFGGRVHL